MDGSTSTGNDSSQGNVPFSWEKKAGVSKVHQPESLTREEELLHNLPPPPCTTEVGGGGKMNCGVQDIQNIPLPPCAFQPPFYRTSSKKGLWVQDDDPFLAAYRECTKTRKLGRNKNNRESVLRKSMSFFSCKRSCAVRNNNLVRISHVSVPHNVHKD